MTGAALEVRGLAAGYGARLAVDDVSFDLGRAQILGVVGESGSGKTTIARVLTGFLAARAGEVRWEGETLGPRRTRAQRRDVQLVFQDPFLSLNPHRTVGSVLGELVRSRGVARPRVRDEVVALLGEVSLPAEVAGSRPAQLSGGQRQRVAIARALAVRPRLIVADEPTSALDVSVQASVLDLFARLRREHGTTIVVITHDLGVVRHLCDRVVVLQGGSVVERGAAAGVLDAPTRSYTRRLVAAVPALPDPDGTPR